MAKKKEPTLSAKELNSILQQDIKWHRKNPGTSACGSAFESGFITGLVQAKRLIRRAFKQVQNA